MKFNDLLVNREARYALGIEETSGRYYVSIPVSNGLVDYEEYYEVDAPTFEHLRADTKVALAFVEACRRHEEDARLIVQPGTNRGTAI